MSDIRSHTSCEISSVNTQVNTGATPEGKNERNAACFTRSTATPAGKPDRQPPQARKDKYETDQTENVENIVVLRDFCHRAHGSECQRCMLACPHNAITPGAQNLPLINEQACTKCGLCLGICDAFSSTRITMADLQARLGRIALSGKQVVLTCEENIFPGFQPANNVVVLPCLGSLSPEFLTRCLCQNMPLAIAADLSYCDECERAGNRGELLYTHAIATAEQYSTNRVGFLDEVPERKSFSKELSSGEGVDRRGAFMGLVEEVGDIASGKRRLRNSQVLQDFYEKRERARALTRLNLGNGIEFNDFIPGGRTRKIMWPKRQMILEAINLKPEVAAHIPTVIAYTDTLKCSNHLACVKVCPTKARIPHPETGELSFDARYCSGCALCVQACPQGAIELLESTAQIFLTDESTQTLPNKGDQS